jgi:rubrerythrin
MTDELPVGASVWEARLFSHLVGHTRREGAMLEEYVTAAKSSESKAFAYLIDLLVEDERRHHRFFNELASSLKSAVELDDADPAVPLLDFKRDDRSDLLEATRRLLEHEHEDKGELKELRKEMRDIEDTSLWGILIDLMIRDTEKHIAILQFIASHTGSK